MTNTSTKHDEANGSLRLAMSSTELLVPLLRHSKRVNNIGLCCVFFIILRVCLCEIYLF